MGSAPPRTAGNLLGTTRKRQPGPFGSLPGYGPAAFVEQSFFDIASDDTWFHQVDLVQDWTSIWVLSVAGHAWVDGALLSPGSHATSGNITYAGVNANTPKQEGWKISAQVVSPGGAGTAATALGQTFAGGSYTGSYPTAVGAPATPTTFNAIPVTPSTDYPIIVPPGGRVTITYFG